MEGFEHIPNVASNTSSHPAKDEKATHEQDEQIRRELISTVLDTAARERLSRIALVSPERSKEIEAILVRMAQAGQLRGRVTEKQLIELIEQMEDMQGKTTTKKSTIVYQRRKDLDDDFDI